MFKFTYTDALGKKRKAFSTAINEVELSDEFNRMGLDEGLIIEIKPVKKPPKEDKTFSLKERIILYQFLKGMIDTGIKTPQSLSKLEMMFEKKKQKQMLNDFRELAERGQPLSTVLNICGSFSPMELSIIKAGEMSGNIPDALTMLVQFLKSKAGLAKGIKKLLIAPVISAIVLYMILYVVTYTLVPSVYEMLNMEQLPLISQAIIPTLYNVSQISIFKVFPAVTSVIILSLPLIKNFIIKVHGQLYKRVRKYRRVIQVYTNINFVLFYIILHRSKIKPEQTLSYLKNNSMAPLNKVYEKMSSEIGRGIAIYDTMDEMYFSYITMSAFRTGVDTGEMDKPLNVLYEYLNEEKENTDETVKMMINLSSMAVIGATILLIMGSIYYPVITGIG